MHVFKSTFSLQKRTLSGIVPVLPRVGVMHKVLGVAGTISTETEAGGISRLGVVGVVGVAVLVLVAFVLFYPAFYLTAEDTDSLSS
jgi:hypothetical protein